MFAVREAGRRLFQTRSMMMVSVMIITAALVLLGVVGVFTFYAHGVVNTVRGNEEINIFLNDALSDSDLLALDGTIASMKEVESTKILSKEDAIKEFEKVFGEGLLSALEKNPLPRSIVVTIAPSYRSAEDMERFVQRFKNVNRVESVEYGREWVSNMDTFFILFIVFEAFFIAFILFVCIIIVSNTITLTVLARRDTIDIMKLVGATDSFIRRPFYFEGLIQGILSGIFSFCLLYGAYYGITRGFPEREVLFAMFGFLGKKVSFEPLLLLLIIPIGGVLGFVGSCAAVRRTV